MSGGGGTYPPLDPLRIATAAEIITGRRTCPACICLCEGLLIRWRPRTFGRTVNSVLTDHSSGHDISTHLLLRPREITAPADCNSCEMDETESFHS